MKILMTGFEPFGGESINPSYESVRLINDSRIVKLLLPVSYERAGKLLSENISKIKPDFILCVGQAGGRTCVTPERRAVNRGKGKDCDGFDFGGKEIYTGKPEELLSDYSEKFSEAIKNAGLPSYVSESAGEYVCNFVMYSALLSEIPASFIHVPYIPAQTVKFPEKPSMSIENIVASLSAALSVL